MADAEVVVEWGGGYGNLAKLLRRVHGGRPTYVIIDTPLFAALQWLYLSATSGARTRSCWRGQGHRGAGVARRPHRRDRRPVRSTWALNESPPALQAAVADGGWYGAPRLLMDMHRGVPLAERAVAGDARVVDVGPWMPGQTYVLR